MAYADANAAADVTAGAERQSVKKKWGGFSLWRCIVYGLALNNIHFLAVGTYLANWDQVASMVGSLVGLPIVLVAGGAFLNLFSNRKVGPSLATLMLMVVLAFLMVGLFQGWFTQPTAR